MFTPCSHPVHTLFTSCSHLFHTLFTPCSHPVHTLFTPCSHRPWIGICPELCGWTAAHFNGNSFAQFQTNANGCCEYRWVAFNPNTLNLNFWVIDYVLLSFMCYTSCLIQNVPESKDFCWVLFVRIKQDPHVHFMATRFLNSGRIPIRFRCGWAFTQRNRNLSWFLPESRHDGERK